MDEQDKKVLYEIHDALVGTLEKPGLINKVDKHNEDLYGIPNGVISRLGLQQKKQEETEKGIEKAKNKIQGGWMVVGYVVMVIGWIYTTFVRK